MNKISMILPTIADPLMIYLWLENFKKIKHVVNNLFVVVDHIPSHNEIHIDYIKELFNRNNIVNYKFISSNQHGINLRIILNEFKTELDDIIIFSEIDDYIINVDLFEKQINKFKNENIDVCGPIISNSICKDVFDDTLYSSEMSADVWLEFFNSELKSKPKLEIENYDGHPFSFWPVNFLIRREHVFFSNMHFEAKYYLKNETITLGNSKLKIKNDFSLDTFREFTYEILRNTNIRKIHLTNSSLRGCLYESVMCDHGENLNDTFIDYHLSNASTFFQNKFWEKASDLTQSPYIQEYNNTDTDIFSIADHHRVVEFLYEMLLHLDDSQFEFYNIYKFNMKKYLDLCKPRINSYLKDSKQDYPRQPFFKKLILRILPLK